MCSPLHLQISQRTRTLSLELNQLLHFHREIARPRRRVRAPLSKADPLFIFVQHAQLVTVLYSLTLTDHWTARHVWPQVQLRLSQTRRVHDCTTLTTELHTPVSLLRRTPFRPTATASISTATFPCMTWVHSFQSQAIAWNSVAQQSGAKYAQQLITVLVSARPESR